MISTASTRINLSSGFNSFDGQPSSPSPLSCVQQLQQRSASRSSLQEELLLDRSDLRSHAWYHGNISRERCEQLLTQSGHFLVRDCTSKRNHYVLSCRSKRKSSISSSSSGCSSTSPPSTATSRSSNASNSTTIDTGMNDVSPTTTIGTSVLHFMINQVKLKQAKGSNIQERVQYMLEDETFDTIPDLITFYVGNKRPVSKISGAVITTPVNRSYAIGSLFGDVSKMSTKVTNGNHKEPSIGFLNNILNNCSKPQQPLPKVNNTSNGSKKTSHGRITPILDMLVKPLVPSCDEVNPVVTFRRCSMTELSSLRSSRPSSRSSLASTRISFASNGSHDSLPTTPLCGNRKITMDSVETTEDIEAVGTKYNADDHYLIPNSKPPIPVYVNGTNSFKVSRIMSSAKDIEEDIEDGYAYIADVDDDVPCPVDVRNVEVPIVVKPKSSVSIDELYTKTSRVPMDMKSVINCGPKILIPNVEEKELLPNHPCLIGKSCLEPSYFMSDLLPSDNKPLEASTMSQVHNLILKSGSRFLANHLTAIDLEFIGHYPFPRQATTPSPVNGPPMEQLQVSATNNDLKVSNKVTESTFQLLLLPEGSKYRSDLLDKRDCLKYFVAVTILLKGSDSDRAALINKWILIAMEIKNNLGNFNGFTGIISGLTLLQIRRLNKTWTLLRRTFTESAVLFETQLRPFMNKLMAGTANCDVNNGHEQSIKNVTCFPYILSLIEVLQKSPDDDQDIESTARHLKSGKEIILNVSKYQSNGMCHLQNVSFEEIVLDMFRPEFHQRLLWGSRGCDVPYEDRCNKMDQVLMVLSMKWEEDEPDDDDEAREE